MYFTTLCRLPVAPFLHKLESSSSSFAFSSSSSKASTSFPNKIDFTNDQGHARYIEVAAPSC